MALYTRLAIVTAVLLTATVPGCSRPDRSPELHRAFEGAGEPMPEPAFGDWLQQHPEKGQAFEQFVRSKPLLPDSRRHKIYLQPLGTFGEDAPSLDFLERFAAAFFSLEVEVLPASKLEEGPPVQSRLGVGKRERRQYLSTDVLARLGKQIPPDAFALLGVTLEDLYPKPEWNFVFGQASLRNRVGIYSFARYDPAFYGEPRPADWRRLSLLRSCKVLAHETGHMFGIRHCTFYRCVMNGSNHLGETDSQPLHLCPVDLRKLNHSVGFDPLERYRKLLALSEEAGFLDEEAWLRAEIGRLTSTRRAPRRRRRDDVAAGVPRPGSLRGLRPSSRRALRQTWETSPAPSVPRTSRTWPSWR